MKSIIGNSPFRTGVNPKSWGLANVTHFTTGGTLSRDPLHFLTDEQLLDVASTGLKEVYSLCLGRTPQREFQEVLRHESFGIDIPFIRLGNEEGNYIKPTGVTIDVIWQWGFDRAVEHVAAVNIYKNLFPSDTYRFIYCGMFVSNQVGERINLYRDGWNQGLRSAIGPNDIIDLHIYRKMDKDRVNMDYFNEINSWENPVCIIECGVDTKTIPLGGEGDFIIQTEEIWGDVKNSLREKDIMGVQLIENLGERTGLIFDGALTEIGEIFNQLFPKVIAPPSITIVEIYKHWVSYLSPFTDWLRFTLSDGTVTEFLSFSKGTGPVVGDVWPLV